MRWDALRMKHQTAAEDQRSADLTSGSPAVNFRFSSNNLYLEAMRGDETAQTPNWSQLKRRDVNRERSEEGVSSHFDSARPVGGRQQNKRHRGSCSLPSEHWVCGGSDRNGLNWGWRARRRPQQISKTEETWFHQTFRCRRGSAAGWSWCITTARCGRSPDLLTSCSDPLHIGEGQINKKQK